MEKISFNDCKNSMLRFKRKYPFENYIKPKKWFKNNICLYVCCRYQYVDPKLLDRFFTNFHKTCTVGKFLFFYIL